MLPRKGVGATFLSVATDEEQGQLSCSCDLRASYHLPWALMGVENLFPSQCCHMKSNGNSSHMLTAFELTRAHILFHILRGQFFCQVCPNRSVYSRGEECESSKEIDEEQKIRVRKASNECCDQPQLYSSKFLYTPIKREKAKDFPDTKNKQA